MQPFRHVVPCQCCGQPATFKIASRWSDGDTAELKTYSLCCEACLPGEFRASVRKQAACRTVTGETLGLPEVFRHERGQRDKELVRAAELARAATHRPAATPESP